MERVSKFLRHSSVKVTEKRYAHLTREAARSLELDRAFWGGGAAALSPQSVRIDQAPGSEEMPHFSKAPEVGLEPTTTRLTVERSTN
jgi:hypothetical protein